MGTMRHDHQELVESLKRKNTDFTAREFSAGGSMLWLIYIRQLVDAAALSQFVAEPVIDHLSRSLARPRAQRLAQSVITALECNVGQDADALETVILQGMTVLLLDCDESYLIINAKKVEHRSIHTPDFAYSILGPKDCFVENLDMNLSLIRYRLKDPNLKIDMFELGKRTKTNFAVLYLADVADEEMIATVEARLRSIDTDAIWGTGDVPSFLSNSRYCLFEQHRVTERSDTACEALTEGKAVLLGDGGHIALIAPRTFSESFFSEDDRYGNRFFGLFSGILRYIAVLITLCSTALYVALVSYHPDALPGDYVILLANMRQSVLFSATVEVLIVEFLLEVVREALLRVPTKIGTAIGIVGAIVIGNAATSAGIFDSLVLILVAASLLSSFAMPDYFSMNPFRILKFFVIAMTGILGFYGFVLALSLILTNLVSIDSFGTPFFAPFAPFGPYDTKRAFIFSRSTTALRMQYMRTKDDTRSPYAHNRMKRSDPDGGDKNK